MLGFYVAEESGELMTMEQLPHGTLSDFGKEKEK
jgi:hypothetical protein